MINKKPTQRKLNDYLKSKRGLLGNIDNIATVSNTLASFSLPAIAAVGLSAIPAGAQIVNGNLNSLVVVSTTGANTATTVAINPDVSFYVYVGGSYLAMSLKKPNGRMFDDSLGLFPNLRDFASGEMIPTTGTNNPNRAGTAFLTKSTGNGGNFINGAPFKFGIVGWHDSILPSGFTNTDEGWIRVSVDERSSPGDNVILRFHDFAYTTNNTPTSINAGQTVVPVEFLNFTVRSDGKKIKLSWKTASETDNAGFEIQRSTDGKKFNNITFIEGGGTTTEARTYAYNDVPQRRRKLYYYRLKQIDFGGAFSYSSIVSAQIDDAERSISISPNPGVGGKTQLEYTAEAGGQLHIRIYDVSGKELLHQPQMVNQGINRIGLDISSLGAGMFFAKIEQDNFSVYKKVVVQHEK